MIIDAALRDEALPVIERVAQKLSAVEQVEAVLEHNLQERQVTSFACGLSGIALALLQLHQYGFKGNYKEVAQRYIARIAERTRLSPLDLVGLSNGTTGVAIAVTALCREEDRYSHMQTQLQEQLALQILHKQWYRENARGVDERDYGILYGVAGVLAYLVTINHPSEKVQQAIEALITYCIWLAQGEGEQKRWFVAPEFFSEGLVYGEAYAGGYFNCGFAHGIAGPLAALSLAWQAGYRFPGQYEAITTFAEWILAHRIYDAWGMNWPVAVPVDESHLENNLSAAKVSQAGWCYGVPGISRALWLAGTALEHMQWRQVALDAIEGVLRRPIEKWHITTPAFCHGFAGVLTICTCFAHETRSTFLGQEIPSLVRMVLERFCPEALFGFRNEEERGIYADDPGLLNGASGSLLALLTAVTPQMPDWVRAFLIA